MKMSFVDEEKEVPHYEEAEVDQEDDETVLDPAGEEDEGSSDDGEETRGQKEAHEDEPDRRVNFKGGDKSRAVVAAKKAAREAQVARDEAAAIRREFEEFRRSAEERSNRPDPDAEQHRISLMDPEERINYFREQDKREMTAHMRRLEMNFADQTDRAAFQAQVSVNPKLGRYADKVESIYQENRRNAMARGGTPPDRATILRWVIGDEAVKNAGTSSKPTRLSRQTTKPASARGDVPSGGKRAISEEERLAKYTF
jgi:hypothetical protein